jgi:hypothetical protein
MVDSVKSPTRATVSDSSINYGILRKINSETKKKLVPVSKSPPHQMTWCSVCSCLCIQCHDICNIWYQITKANDDLTESRYTQHTSHKLLHAWSQGLHFRKSWVLATKQAVISGFILPMHLADCNFFSLNKMLCDMKILNPTCSYSPMSVM